MTLDEFVLALEEHDCRPVERRGGKWQAHCPAHDDRKPSLYFEAGRVVPVVATCVSAGCPFKAVREALGLSDEPSAEPYVPPVRKEPTPEPLPSEASLNLARSALTRDVAVAVSHYKPWSFATLQAFGIGYADKRLVIPAYERGELANVYRYSPTGEAPKKKGLANRPGVLFHNPALAHIPTDIPLWIVEGEPDVLSAYELGLWAVGIPGVTTWQQKYAERFRGRHVRVCMDCDRAGREAAYRIFADLAPVVEQGPGGLRHIDPWPEREDGYDLTDFLMDARKRGDVAGARAVVRYWQDR